MRRRCRPSATAARLGRSLGWRGWRPGLGTGPALRNTGTLERSPAPSASPSIRPSPNPTLGFQRMAEGVAVEIEQGAAAGLAFILGDNLGLHLNGTRNGVNKRRRLARQHCGGVGLQPLEEGEVAEEAVLDRLGRSRRASSAVGQGGQHYAVLASTRRGWMVGPDQVLLRGVSMAVLPPTEESTCASRVVGIASTKSILRL